MATTKTQAEIDAYEAKIQRAQAAVRQMAENVFIVPSDRPLGDRHIVTTNECGVANYCSCKGWKYYHKCYCAIAVTRYVEAQKAVKVAEAIVAEAAKTPEQAQIEAYIAQGVDPVTARRVVEAEPVKASHAKAYEPKAFSLLK